MSYSIGQVARLAGVTVRTLHHYDEMGLLTPSGRTGAGYRRYEDPDLARLQRVLFYRELGFPLDAIATLLDDPDVDELEHLRRQHELLTARIGRLQTLVASLELTMEARQMDIQLTPEERLEVFGEAYVEQHPAYVREAEERWGDTDAWAQSRRRTSTYSKDDWQAILAEAEAITSDLAAAMRDGVAATDDRAVSLVEAYRQHISRWFYDCSPRMQLGLGEMYVADPRFAETYDRVADGLAVFVRDAIRANAARHGVDPDSAG